MLRTVYALVDPRTSKARYIGLTKAVPRKRLIGHITYAKQGKTPPVCTWIRELLSDGQRPIMVVLGTTCDKRMERHWVHQLIADGADLLNIQLLGDGYKKRRRYWVSKKPAQLGRKYSTAERFQMSLRHPRSVFSR
jgi:hypothetical protein